MYPHNLPCTACLAEKKPHGNRIKYRAGCRCNLCRKANARYSSKRRLAVTNGEWNGLVDASAVRKRLIALSRAGVGRRAVATATDIPQSALSEISLGHRLHLCKRNHDKIMAVTVESASDSASISSRAAWRQVDQLIDEGFSVLKLSQVLGVSRNTMVARRKHILASTAAQIDRFYRSIMKESEAA